MRDETAERSVRWERAIDSATPTGHSAAEPTLVWPPPARVPCVSNLVVHSLLYVQTQLANETAAVTHQHNVICVIECAPSDCFTERF